MRPVISAVAAILGGAGNTDVAEALDVNRPRDNGITALYAACEKNSKDCVELLLSHSDIEINRTRSGGYTALYIACQKNSKDCVELLVNAGADATLRAANGKTARDIAVEKGNDACAALLQ